MAEFIVDAIIVTYLTTKRDAPDLSKNIEATLAQVRQLILVDNGSDHMALEMLRQLKARHSNIILIENHANLGLAAAQNLGITHAITTNATHVLLLDDDSLPQPQMVAKLLKYANKQTAILAPALQEPHSTHISRIVVPRWFGFQRIRPLKPEKALAVIASGSLISTHALQNIGLMREDFFIDYVDVEWCLRARHHGYEIWVIPEATLQHRLGNKTRNFGGFITSNHSPERRYTIFRNRTICWKAYLTKRPRYLLYDMMAALYDIGRIAIFEQQRLGKLKAALRGFWHGLRHSKLH